MKKLLTILLMLIAAQSFAQEQGVYQRLPIYGANYKRIRTDSALLVPVKAQTVNSTDSSAQFYYNIQDSSFWGYSKDRGFFKVSTDRSSYHTLGQASDYFTLNTLDGRKDTVSFPKDTQYVKNPLYSDNDTLKFHSDSLTSVLKYSGIDSSAYDDNTLIPKSYLNDRISQVTSTGITRTELQDTAAAIRSDISTGSVQSVTGLNTDNTDPANPVVKISVDGSTITGSGTPADPLVSAGGGGTTSIQTQTVSGSTTLTFTSVPASYSDYEIFRNGVRNYPVTDYTTSGNNITIPAVDDGDIIILQRIK